MADKIQGCECDTNRSGNCPHRQPTPADVVSTSQVWRELCPDCGSNEVNHTAGPRISMCCAACGRIWSRSEFVSQPPATPPETSGERCPGCQSPVKNCYDRPDGKWTVFDCGSDTILINGELNPSHECEHRQLLAVRQQLAAVTEERDRLAISEAASSGIVGHVRKLLGVTSWERFETAVDGLKAKATAATSRAERAEAEVAAIIKRINQKLEAGLLSGDLSDYGRGAGMELEAVLTFADSHNSGAALLERMANLERIVRAAFDSVELEWVRLCEWNPRKADLGKLLVEMHELGLSRNA